MAYCVFLSLRFFIVVLGAYGKARGAESIMETKLIQHLPNKTPVNSVTALNCYGLT